MKNEWLGVGIMSGTSLDGIDMALCKFVNSGKHWSYAIEDAKTVPYSDDIREKLSRATRMTAEEYAMLDVELGNVFAAEINGWLESKNGVDFVASHGHTVFHQPERRLTAQIGSGAVIAAKTGLTVVCDFRTKDVALGGQGAPLVPVGDALLFSEYDACLNLGGFSNISYNSGAKRIAFDISPCNMALNLVANSKGLPFDRDGELSSKGICIDVLLKRLNNLPYYKQNPPKSLGKEWFESGFQPLLEENMEIYGVENVLRTIAEHIACQVNEAIPKYCRNVLVTGGGAHNKFVLQLLKQKCKNSLIVVPDNLTIDFKEAIVFSFLGLLRLLRKSNTLASVTGAPEDSVGGCIYV